VDSWSEKRSTRKHAEANDRHQSRYCAASGCRNLGTMSHANTGDNHRWLCPDHHFGGESLPPAGVTVKQASVSPVELRRRSMEAALSAELAAAVGAGAPRSAVQAWWRARARELARRLPVAVRFDDPEGDGYRGDES
jgi:hypothetical protein